MSGYQDSLYRHFYDEVVKCDTVAEGNLKLKEFDGTLNLVKADDNGHFNIIKGDSIVASYRSDGLSYVKPTPPVREKKV